MLSKLSRVISIGSLMLYYKVYAQRDYSQYDDNNYSVIQIPFTQPKLLDAALSDLERMQSMIINRPVNALNNFVTNPFVKGLDLLQTLSPFTLDDLISCRSIFPTSKSKNSDNYSQDWNSSSDYSSDYSNDYTTEQPRYYNSNNNVLSRLSSPLTAITQRVTTPLVNQVLDILQPRAAQASNTFSNDDRSRYNPTSNNSRCRHIANSPLLGLERGIKFVSEKMDDALQTGFELPITLLSSMLEDQTNYFNEFMKSARNEAINRLSDQSTNLSEILYEIESQGEQAISNGQNTLTTLIDRSSNTVIDTIDNLATTVVDALDAQPSLFAWLVRSIQTAASPVLRGSDSSGNSTDVMQFGIAPFQLGRDIASLSHVYPPLTRLFQYINQPAAAPAFLTLRSLLDEITETGTLDNIERFPHLFQPFRQFIGPLDLQLGVSNAVLQYLDILFGQ